MERRSKCLSHTEATSMAICKTTGTVLKCLLLQLNIWFLFEEHICPHVLLHSLVNNGQFWFPKVPTSRSHLSSSSRCRRPSGGSGERSSNYTHTQTNTELNRRVQKRRNRCGHPLHKQQQFQLRLDGISAMRLRVCGTSSAAQKRNCF